MKMMFEAHPPLINIKHRETTEGLGPAKSADPYNVVNQWLESLLKKMFTFSVDRVSIMIASKGGYNLWETKIKVGTSL